MRRLLLVLVLLLGVPLQSWAAIAFVTDRVTARASGNLSGSTAFTPTAGALLVVSYAVYNSSGCTSVAVYDSVGGPGAPYTSNFLVHATDANACIGQAYQNSVTAVSRTITIDPNGSSADMDFVTTEITGQETSGTVTDTPTTTTATGGTTNATFTTGTLAQANNAIVAIVTQFDATTTLTVGAGYTQAGENENNTTGQSYNAQRKLVTATTGVVVNWTQGASNRWEAAVGVYKEASGAAPPRQRLSIMD